MVLRSKTINLTKLNALVGAYNLRLRDTDEHALVRGEFKDGWRINFRLDLIEPTPKDQDETALYQRRSYTGRRIRAVCWHGHRDVMKSIFTLDPEARLDTSVARYDGSEDFKQKYPETGNRNIGSQMQPMYFDSACDCGALG